MKTTYGLRAIRRHTADGWHYFIVNLTPKDITGDVTLAVPFESATWFNPMNGDIQPAEVHNGQLHIALKSGESRILQTPNQPSTNITTTASGTEEITLQGPWVLSFTDESPRVEGTFKLNKPPDVGDTERQCCRYHGYRCLHHQHQAFYQQATALAD